MTALAEGLAPRLRAALGAGAATGPMYRRLAAALRGLIEAGALKGGDALPSERELAAGTGRSRVTVRKAIDVLCADGLIARRHGAGSFVTRPIEQPLSVLVGFTEDMNRRGGVTASRVLARSTGPADPALAQKLGLAPGAPVLRLSRVRLSDGEPLAIEHAAVPGWAMDEAALGPSLYEALRARGHGPVRALQRLHAGLATPEEARLLGLAPGAAVLRIERRSLTADDRPVEVTVSAYRGDRYDFVAELTLQA